jgi:hypothetical protein
MYWFWASSCSSVLGYSCKIRKWINFDRRDRGTFIRGVLAHPRRYTFDHGWERAQLRASLTVHVSQKSTVYLRRAPPLTVVAPCWRCRSARRCPPSPPPCAVVGDLVPASPPELRHLGPRGLPRYQRRAARSAVRQF